MKKPSTPSIVKSTIDSMHPPQLSAEALARMSAIRDEDIDVSDIPSLSDDGEWYSPSLQLPDTKTQVTLRLDKEVLDYFKSDGKRYQTRINAALVQYVQAKKGIPTPRVALVVRKRQMKMSAALLKWLTATELHELKTWLRAQGRLADPKKWPGWGEVMERHTAHKARA